MASKLKYSGDTLGSLADSKKYSSPPNPLITNQTMKRISIGLIGPGQIGSTLLRQIKELLRQLKRQSGFSVSVLGIMNRTKMLLSQDAIDLSRWHSQLLDSPLSANFEAFIEHLHPRDDSHVLIIDCTASQQIAGSYLELMNQGFHIITPNKHANCGDLNYYKQLKSLSSSKKVSYFYETTVGAGLPVLSVLHDLIRSGDHIECIEGVVSGTISYILGQILKGNTFSEAVFEARSLGYTEPDPREDLSGMDVARKCVCLAREAGFNAHLDDVNIESLVPPELSSCSVDEFLSRLSDYDSLIKNRVSEAQKNHKKLVYTGSINEKGIIQLAIKEFSSEHPFCRLQGPDNMIIFQTRRYHSQPLIIQGPGAGAEVTAAGLLAELVHLVDYLS